MGKNEKDWTIENFVDVVNEVILQVTDDKDMYDRVQLELLKFLKDKTTIDEFAFEFAMLLRKRDKAGITAQQFTDSLG